MQKSLLVRFLNSRNDPDNLDELGSERLIVDSCTVLEGLANIITEFSSVRSVCRITHIKSEVLSLGIGQC